MGVPVCSFNSPPPASPQLYLTQKHLIQLGFYGTLACPYTPPAQTVYPSAGQLGWWQMRIDGGARRRPNPHIVPDIEDSNAWTRFIAARLAGMRVTYEDFGTGDLWLWVLTDRVLHRDNDNDLRLAVWPD